MQPFRRSVSWHLASILGAALVLVACFGPSDLPPAKAGGGEATPALLPLSQILGQAAEGARSAELGQEPDARIAALRARAEALRGPVITPSERRRMEGAARRLD